MGIVTKTLQDPSAPGDRGLSIVGVDRIIKLNKASRKKDLLIELATQDHDDRPASDQGPESPSPRRDHIGFGRHADLTYSQLFNDTPNYANWAAQTHQENVDAQTRIPNFIDSGQAI